MGIETVFMITRIFRKIIGTRNDRILRGYNKQVAAINALEPTMQALTDDQLRAKTSEFKQRLQQGATLDSLLVEAFALVREASRRTLGLRHFDVQLIGGWRSIMEKLRKCAPVKVKP